MLLAPFAIRLLRLQPPGALWETTNTNRQEVLIEFSFQTTRYGIKFCIHLFSDLTTFNSCNLLI